MSLLEFCEISTKWLFSHRHFIDKLILLIVTKSGNNLATHRLCLHKALCVWKLIPLIITQYL